MTWLPINLIISLLFMVSIIGVGIFIQINLSRSENKYFGLILPIISFLSAVLMVIGLYSFTASSYVTSVSVTTTDETGEIIEESEEVVTDSGKIDLTIENMLSMASLFLVSNIPTIVLGGIYISERNKINMRKSIEKMKIEDL